MRPSDSARLHGHSAMRVARRWHYNSGRAHIFGFICLGLAVSLAGHVSISWFVVSAPCVCDNLNFRNCTKCVDMFSVLRSRILGPIMFSITSRNMEGSSDVPERSELLSAHVLALGSHGVFETKGARTF